MSTLLVRFLVYSACLALPICAADTLTVFVKGTSEALGPMRAEVARLMEPTGLNIEWKDLSDRKAGEDFARLVNVELRGQCIATLGTSVNGDVRSLASTAVVDGRVLPFSAIECDRLRKVLSPTLMSAKRELWVDILGRAMGRVFAHELFHMLAQTKTHHSAGVSKSCFSVADLISDRFSFDALTVAQLRPAIAEDPILTDFAEDATGR